MERLNRMYSFVCATALPWLCGLLVALTLSDLVAASCSSGEASAASAGSTPKQLSALIHLLAPHVPMDRARSLGVLLSAYSPDPVLSVAILMQESGFQDKHVEYTGIDELTGRPARVAFDLGVAQLNWGTVVAFQCDARKLLDHDLREAVRCHSLVLRDKLMSCADLGRDAFGCYNSRSELPRLAYLRAVRKHLRRMGVDR